ncbi:MULTISPECIES: YceI family protein [unclassified Luteococcus]|uniref:YceI family protein n=1 Tax=unclassified Luteococcus TaxID=2639923 RepID=UPI00313C636C
MTEMTQLEGSYALDTSNSSLAFVARHSMITKVRGIFTAFTGSAQVHGQDPASSSVTVEVDVTSVDTGSKERDEHLVSGDFFDAAQFPTITFVSTGVEAVDSDSVEITGDLTIKGITRPVTIGFEFTGTATDPSGNERIGFEGRTEVNRRDFNLTWNAALDTGGVLVSEKITLEFEISAIKQA